MVSSGDSTVMSSRKGPRRRFTCKEKSKKKMLQYEFGSAASDRSEFDIGPIEKEPPRKRSKLAEKVVKIG